METRPYLSMQLESGKHTIKQLSEDMYERMNKVKARHRQGV